MGSSLAAHAAKLFSGAATLLLAATGAAQAIQPTGSETVLYTFSGGADGAEPHGALIMQKDGTLFGTTMRGGNLNQCTGAGCGTVFMLTPPPSGQSKWSYTVLYTFGGGTDGAVPMSALVMDKNGSLFGTTRKGGSANCGSFGCGTVFELSPPAVAGSAWTYSQLYAFSGADGAQPEAELMIDPQGNLLGTTTLGGASDMGAVFSLSPPVAGSNVWTQQILYSFTGKLDGGHVSGPVTEDQSGNLYGTASYGGNAGSGVVFELLPPSSPQTAWTQAVLYSLPGGANGGYPRGAVTIDTAGNLYTTATNIALELSPLAGGGWTANTLHAFSSLGDANIPFAGLAQVVYPGTTALYGTAGYGTATRFGGIYKLAAPTPQNPNWNEALIYAFSGGSDGGNPFGGILPAPGNVFFGTTTFGGNLNGCDIGCGVIYEVMP